MTKLDEIYVLMYNLNLSLEDIYNLSDDEIHYLATEITKQLNKQ